MRLALVLLLGAMVAPVCAQNPTALESKPAELEVLVQAEADIQLVLYGQTMRRQDLAVSVNRRLTEILKQNPSTPLRPGIEADLLPIQEILGEHDLAIAMFYLSRGHATRGAESRLLRIVDEFPHFSQMDEVLFQLSTLSRNNDRSRMREPTCGS